MSQDGAGDPAAAPGPPPAEFPPAYQPPPHQPPVYPPPAYQPPVYPPPAYQPTQYQPSEYPPAQLYLKAPPPPPVRRRGRIWWRVGVVASVLVLAAGVTTAVVSYLRIASPTQVVRSYFDAIQAGDAPQALRYGREVAGDRSYLTSAVLRIQRGIAPIGALTVTTATQHGDAATVTVSYTIGTGDGAKAVSEPVTLHTVSRHWLLDTPAAVVRIDPGNGRNRATLAGLTLPRTAIALFPGAVPVTYDTDLLVQGPRSDRITLASTGTVSVAASLTDSARTTVVGAVRTAMATCLKQAAAAPATCPLTPRADRAVPGALRGTVSALDVDEQPALVSGDANGLLEIDGTFSVTGTWTTLDFNNLSVPHSGRAAVPVTAQMYVSAPTALTWVAQ